MKNVLHPVPPGSAPPALLSETGSRAPTPGRPLPRGRGSTPNLNTWRTPPNSLPKAFLPMEGKALGAHIAGVSMETVLFPPACLPAGPIPTGHRFPAFAMCSSCRRNPAQRGQTYHNGEILAFRWGPIQCPPGGTAWERSTHRPGNTSSQIAGRRHIQTEGFQFGGQSQTVPVGVVSVQYLLPNPHLSNFLGEFLTTIGETACIVWEQSIAFRPNAFLSPLLVGRRKKSAPKTQFSPWVKCSSRFFSKPI